MINNRLEETFYCPECHSTKFNPKYLKDQLLVCDKNNIYGEKCNTFIKAYCKKCGKYLDSDRFGKNGNVFVCKECNQIQWGVTEFERHIEETWFQDFIKSNSRQYLCSKCHNNVVDESYLQDGLQVCSVCKNISMIYCTNCKNVSSLNRFGIHGDVWECKTCRATHWGLTDYIRSLKK